MEEFRRLPLPHRKERFPSSEIYNPGVIYIYTIFQSYIKVKYWSTTITRPTTL
jgi:hypothetical protein